MFVSAREVILASIEKDIEKLARQLGIEALEIYLERELKAFSPTGEKTNVLKSRAEFLSAWKKSGLKIFSILEANDFSGDVKEEVDYIVSGIMLAEDMEAEVVRIDPLPKKEGATGKEEAIEKAVVILREALNITRSSSIKLGLENHGVLGNDPDFLIKVIDRVNSPRLGYTLDTGNFYWSGKPLSRVYEIMEELSPRVYHAHVKNIKYPPHLREKAREVGYEYGKYVSPVFEGDIDYAKVMKILKKAGYKGDFCLEDESLGKYDFSTKKEILKKDLAYLKSLLPEQ